MNPQSGDEPDVPTADAPPDNQADGTTSAQAAAPEGPEAPAEGPEEHQREYEFKTPMPEGVPPELAAKIDAIAPDPPQDAVGWDDEKRARWEICARTAAAMAVHQQAGHEDEVSDSDARQFAWHAARAMFDSDAPTGDLSQVDIPADDAETAAA